MPWLDNKAPNIVKINNIEKQDKGITIKWQDEEKNDSTYYVIYRFDGNEIGDIQNPKNILTTVRRINRQTYLQFNDLSASIDRNYTYAITALDRLHNESEPTVFVYMRK